MPVALVGTVLLSVSQRFGLALRALNCVFDRIVLGRRANDPRRGRMDATEEVIEMLCQLVHGHGQSTSRKLRMDNRNR